MKYLNPVDETARALAFLTRLSIPDRYFSTMATDKISDCAGFYPVAGALIGLFGGALLALSAALGLPNLIGATLATIAIILLTGALHEDGLADVADGFGGGANRERRLEIMKDSRIGVYGTLAIVASFAMRVTCVSAIMAVGGLVSGIAALVASSAFSRGAMVWFWASLPNARGDGVAAHAGQPSESAVSLAAIFGLSIGAIVALIANGFVAATLALVLGLSTMLGLQKLCNQMIGGQTGDTMGCCQQCVEITFLIGLASQLSMSI